MISVPVMIPTTGTNTIGIRVIVFLLYSNLDSSVLLNKLIINKNINIKNPLDKTLKGQ